VRLGCCAWLLGAGLPLAAQTAPAGDSAELARAATELIAKRCVSCHNPSTTSGGLNLTSFEAALKGGYEGPAIVPGRPDKSPFYQRVAAGEMPMGSPLPGSQRELLRKWVEAGAPWKTAAVDAAPAKRPDRSWWSLQPLAVKQAPDAPGIPEAWKASPIDRFLYVAMAEKGLSPSSPADRRTLIRRVTFDLTGLPPTPEEIAAFVADTSEDAWERLIDRLLASPAYGERWGRHWLDVIRFGESHGYEQNHLRERAWPFRDWVIRSFNEDKPFDRMVIEQLAGDQVGKGDPAVEAATGFLVAGPHDTVGIQNIEGQRQQRANDMDDIIAATGAGFLGLTVGCARCHDHKFDPIPQADYYRLRAVFEGVQHLERPLATAAEIRAHEEQRQPLEAERERLEAEIAAIEKQAQPEVEARREAILAGYRPPVDPRGVEEAFAPVEAQFVRMTIRASTRNHPPALDEIEVWTPGPEPKNVALAAHGARAAAHSSRQADGDPSIYAADLLIDGDYSKFWFSGEAGTGEVTIDFGRPERIARIVWSRDRRGGFQDRFLSNVPTEYVFEVSIDGRQWQAVASSEGRLPLEETARNRLLLEAVLDEAARARWRDATRELEEVRKRLAALPKLATAYIGDFVQPEAATRIDQRGDPMKPGEVAPPGSLSALEGVLDGFALDPQALEGERRLALARWIADRRNALTARVLANRIWHYRFGRGIVGTPSDFGLQGEAPTHPELLDYLAGRLIELGWRLKPFHKEILMTAAYRQVSDAKPEWTKIDSDARYLWRFPARRLDAEALRDAILAVSGRLDTQMGGPGFRLYRYTVDNVATYYPIQEFGADTYRRAVYHQHARSVKAELLGQFDMPDPALPAPARVVTTTPLQALALLNNRFLIDQSRQFAQRLEEEAGGSLEGQIERAYLLALGRPPETEEARAAVDLAARHGLWIFCRALLNSNEFLYVM
jgi:mono/diheme cytochrome c family protein